MRAARRPSRRRPAAIRRPRVQWEVSTDGGTTFNAISGATSTTYSFTASAAENGNQYEAVFTNSIGTLTSSPATLTVETPPVVTTNPANQTVSAGHTALHGGGQRQSAPNCAVGGEHRWRNDVHRHHRSDLDHL